MEAFKESRQQSSFWNILFCVYNTGFDFMVIIHTSTLKIIKIWKVNGDTFWRFEVFLHSYFNANVSIFALF
jgi:hypothetical protein